MARPLKPFVRSGGYYPSAKYTPLVYPGGYTTLNAKNGKTEPLNTFVGKIVQFLAKRSLPMVKLEANFTPIQSLNGQEAPWPPGGGKNKMPPAIAKTETINGVTFTSDGDGNYTAVGTATADALCYFYLPSVFVILSSKTDADKPKIALNNTQSMATITFRFYYEDLQIESWWCAPQNRFQEYGNMRGRNCNRYAIQVPSGVTANIKCSPMLVEHSVTDPTFAPYSNICPISGHTGCDIFDKAEYDAQATPTVSISFGTTVYGGKLTVFDDGSGQIDATIAAVDMGSLTWQIYESGSHARFGSTGISDSVKPPSSDSTLANILCSIYKIDTSSNIYNHVADKTIAVGANGNVYSYDTQYATAADFKTAVTGQTLCYELAAPVTIPLTASQINTLVGENNVWVNDATGDITVQAYGTEIV